MKLSLVVPCYNEQDNVENFYRAVCTVFADGGFDYEIIFVNDGSKDETYKKLKSIYQNDTEKVRVVNFSRNFGKEAAMYAGLRESCGDYVSIIDADLQQNPKYVLQMMEMLDQDEDLDCVAAYQKDRKESKTLVFFKNTFYKLINKMAEVDFVSGASDFRTFRRSMANSLVEMKEYFRFSKGLFSWVGYNTAYIPYEVEDRTAGTSKWSFAKLFKYAIDGILAFSTTPLRIATAVGGITALLSILYLIVVVIQKLAFSINVPGYATIVVLILLLGGIQLFSLGIIGEYLAKVYIQSKDRPIYIAKNVLRPEDKDKE